MRNFLYSLGLMLLDIWCRIYGIGYVIEEISMKWEKIVNQESIKKLCSNICMIISCRTEKAYKDLSKGRALDMATIVKYLLLEEVGVGTGFLIKEGFVVTTYHIVKQKGSNLFLAMLSTGEWIKLELVCFNAVYDLAILRPEVVWSEGLILEFKLPDVGDLVFTMGYPFAYPMVCESQYIEFPPLISVGFVSCILKRQDGFEEIITNIAFNNGNSGGPLFNEENKVIGVVRAKLFFRHPIIHLYEQIFERPSIDLVYGKLKLENGYEEELSLGRVLKLLINMIKLNSQTNIGYAIPSKYIRSLLFQQI